MAFNITYNGLEMGTGTGYHLQEVQGLSSPVIRTSSQDNTNKDGGGIYAQLYSMRVVTLQVEIVGTSVSDYFDKKRAFESAFSKTVSNRVMTIDTWNGDQRTLNDCYVTTTPVHRIEPGKVSTGSFYVELTSGEPFFSDGEDTTYSATLSEGGGFPLPAPLPFSLSGSDNNRFTVSNTGEIAYYPDIYIYGEVVNPSVINATNGIEFQIETEITNGEYIHLYMTNSGPVVLRNDTTSAIESFSGEIPTVDVGDNVFIFDASSGGTGAELNIVWSNRYLSI